MHIRQEIKFVTTLGHKIKHLLSHLVIHMHICRKNIGTDKEYVNYDAKRAPKLEETGLGFLNTANKTIFEDHKYD